MSEEELICPHCAEGIPRERGEDDMGGAWCHQVRVFDHEQDRYVYAVYSCRASDLLEGRTK